MGLSIHVIEHIKKKKSFELASVSFQKHILVTFRDITLVHKVAQ